MVVEGPGMVVVLILWWWNYCYDGGLVVVGPWWWYRCRVERYISILRLTHTLSHTHSDTVLLRIQPFVLGDFLDSVLVFCVREGKGNEVVVGGSNNIMSLLLLLPQPPLLPPPLLLLVLLLL